MAREIWACGLFLAMATLFGCSQSDGPATSIATKTGSAYLTSTEPAGAMPIGEARQNAKDNDEVVLVGRIGGSEKPFVEGLAAFTVVDPKVPHCSSAEGCRTPWDYCCTQDQVKENVAVVKIVDDLGKQVEGDARGLLGVKELNMVVVHGRAERDADGNLAILADKVFVKE